MTLRELYEKATVIRRTGRAIDFGVGTDTKYTVIFSNEDDAIRIEALHNCADDLLRVREAAEKLMEYAMPEGCDCQGCVNMRAALTRVEDVEGMESAIKAKWIDEGFKRVDFSDNVVYLAVLAVQEYLKEGKSCGRKRRRGR